MTNTNAPSGYLAFQAATRAWYDLLQSFGFRISYDDAETICMYVNAIKEVLRRPAVGPLKSSDRRAPKIPRKSSLGSQKVRSH